MFVQPYSFPTEAEAILLTKVVNEEGRASRTNSNSLRAHVSGTDLCLLGYMSAMMVRGGWVRYALVDLGNAYRTPGCPG